MELVEKAELIRTSYFYALPKIHLDRYTCFRKSLLLLSCDINLNAGPVHGIHNENLLPILPFYDCSFLGYHVNSNNENVTSNNYDVFKKEKCISLA